MADMLVALCAMTFNAALALNGGKPSLHPQIFHSPLLSSSSARGIPRTFPFLLSLLDFFIFISRFLVIPQSLILPPPRLSYRESLRMRLYPVRLD